MKKVLVIEGSPRCPGNTAIVTDRVLAGLGRQGLRVRRIRAVDLAISGCRECGECLEVKDAPGCSQDDDMVEVHDQVLDSDLLVLTSPVFCWGVTGQLKTVVDRFFAILTLVRGKKLALILTAGGDEFDGADLVVRQFRNLARYSSMEYVGQFVGTGCGEPAAVRRNRRLLEAAKKFGTELRAALRGR